MQFKRTRSQCGKCPLDGCQRVWSEYNVERPRIAFIAEAPGAQEVEQRKPLCGPSGSLIQQAAAKAGIIWHTAYRGNVICCRPPDNDITSVEGEMAMECCKPGLEEELAFMKKLGIQTYALLGATSMHALGIQGSITKARGSVYQLNGGVAIPTFHPSYIMRGAWAEEVTWINDLAKVRSLSLKSYKPPVEKFNLFPTLEDVRKFVKEAIEKDRLVAVDIETTSLNPFYSKILMIGLAMDGETAVVVPLVKQFGKPYWSNKDYDLVFKELKKLFEKAQTMFQNAPFDTWHLERHGLPVKRLTHDTMLMHHAIHPELPHNLGYIVSIYGKTPYWKEVVLGAEDRMINMDDKEIRTYNARDTVVLHQVLPGLMEDLKECGTVNTYDKWSMRLVKPLRKMSNKGMLVDRERMKRAATKFKKEATRTENLMKALCELSEGFNFGSGDHMRLLVHGVKPRSFEKVRGELEEYAANGKKRKDTKKYRELVEKGKVFTETEPLYKTNARVRTTDGGSLATDDEALLQIKRAAITRLDAMKSLVRKTPNHVEEEKRIQKLLEFLTLYSKFAVAEKLASTFTGFPVMRDGRVHPSFKIHGTATGRLSSSDPNGQNIPGEVQNIFIAGEGKVLLKADYSNIELRVLAYIANEQVMIDAFERGENIHDVNTKLLFGIDKSHPQWKEIRRAAKVYVFGRSYGGTVEGIYKQILTGVPELQISFDHFRKCDNKYFERLSSYKAWCEAQKKLARDTRVVETAFGRKRILLGLPDEIERQALNTPIQGTAGEICETAIIELDEYFEKHPELGAELVLTVHDSIIVECDLKKKLPTAKAMKKIMEAPVLINGRKIVIPVDIGCGSDWAETDKDSNKMEL
jgi:uracil-DNA glycosylase family 4